MSKIIVEFVEPWYGSEELPVHATITLTKEHAINHAKNIAKAMNKNYLSDEDVFEDFKTVHWAVEKEIE